MFTSSNWWTVPSLRMLLMAGTRLMAEAQALIIAWASVIVVSESFDVRHGASAERR